MTLRAFFFRQEEKGS